MASKEVHHRRWHSRRQIQSVSVAHEGVHAATGPASDPEEVVAVHPRMPTTALRSAWSSLR